MDIEEIKILKHLDKALNLEAVTLAINSYCTQTELKLIQDDSCFMAWEPIPLSIFKGELPVTVLSSWVFVIRAPTITGAERHPNSRQCMVSFKGSGDLQIWSRDGWLSNRLVSNPEASIEKRWISIPTGTWHQAVTDLDNWTVVSFHTVPEAELIEERPDPDNDNLTIQRKYLNG